MVASLSVVTLFDIPWGPCVYLIYEAVLVFQTEFSTYVNK